MKRDLFVDGRPIQLGTRLGKGGEGEVYALAGDSALAAKIYTVEDRRSRESKIAAMIRANLQRRAPLVAFPVSIVRERDNSFAGFVMPRVGGHRPLHDLYSPGSRKHKFPRADYRFLARSATNIARAVASVHASGCVIGDINHSGILISDRAVAALIDADSFQVSEGNQRFFCKVGVPEYTPPELQGQSLAQVVRTPNHDAFGLAVVIFQLLFMGRHPFIGTVRKGDVPPLHEAIRDYRFVYAEDRDVGMDQPPGTPSLSDFSGAVAQSLEKAFSRDSRDSRPTAQEWVSDLELFERSLIRCEDNPLHHYPGDGAACPWCEMEQRLSTILFIPYVAVGELSIHAFDPGAQGFDLEQILRQINAAANLDRAMLQPIVQSTEVGPSSEAIAAAAENEDTTRNVLRVLSFLVAVAIIVGMAELWIVWAPLLWFSFFGGKRKEKKHVDQQFFTRKYIEVERKWSTALTDWWRRCGVEEFESLRTRLQKDAQEYKHLADSERKQINAYHASRKERQLRAFLDDFEICDAKIKGIGPAKEATLKSYGIETAADVDFDKLLTVPGFGPNYSLRLIEWKDKLVARFMFRVQLNDADQQEIARLRSAVATKAATLRRTLIAGPKALAELSVRVSAAAKRPDPVLGGLQAQRDRASADLKLLGIAIPALPTFSQAPVNTGAPKQHRPQSAALPPVATSTPAPQCPRCSSGMVRRTARRGRRRGSAFWGCSRYPQCKGTRNL